MGSNSPNAHLGKGLGDKEEKKFWGGKKKKSNCMYILLWCPFTSAHIKVGVFFLPHHNLSSIFRLYQNGRIIADLISSVLYLKLPFIQP